MFARNIFVMEIWGQDQEVYFSTLRENAKVLLDVEKVLQANAKFIGETHHFLRINAKDLWASANFIGGT